MIRIGQIIEDIDSAHGGTSSAFLEVVSALAALRDRATVVAYCGRPLEGDAVLKRVAALPHVTWRFTARARRLWPGELSHTVARDAALGRIDALQIHGVWSAELVGAARACRKRRVPYLWTPHGMLLRHAISAKSLKKRLFMMAGLAGALRAASAMVYATSGERADSVLPNGASRDTGLVLGLPVRTPVEERELPRLRAEGRARWRFAPEDEVVVFIGRIHPVKRLETTIRALRALRASRPSARLLLVGDGESGYVASLRGLARELGVEDGVTFAGWAAGDDKWQALAAADVAMINSLHENFGYGAVEPLAVGVPAVVTDSLSLAPDIREADVGLVVESGGEDEPARLAAAALKLLSDPRRAERGLRGLAWVRERFSPDAIGARLLEECVLQVEVAKASRPGSR